MTTIQAIILAGGEGTRLRSLHPDLPKLLVPVAGKPFIEHQLDWLQRGGITNIHIATGHLGDKIEEWAASNTPDKLHITTSREPSPLGTGGGLRFAAPYIRSNPILALNGDSLTPNLNLWGLLTDHAARKHGITVAVTRIEKATRYGAVEFEGNGRITAFLEKQDQTRGWINTGVYAVSRTVLDRIAPDTNVSLEIDVFPELVRNRLMYAFQSPPPLLDMGTPNGLRGMEEHVAKRVKG